MISAVAVRVGAGVAVVVLFFAIWGLYVTSTEYVWERSDNNFATITVWASNIYAWISFSLLAAYAGILVVSGPLEGKPSFTPSKS